MVSRRLASGAALAQLVAGLATPGLVLADHGAGGGPAGGPGPIGVALIWGGGAFVIGMLIVAVIARLTRREKQDRS